MADFTFQYLLLFHPSTASIGFYMVCLVRSSNIFCSSALCTKLFFPWYCFVLDIFMLLLLFCWFFFYVIPEIVWQETFCFTFVNIQLS